MKLTNEEKESFEKWLTLQGASPEEAKKIIKPLIFSGGFSAPDDLYQSFLKDVSEEDEGIYFESIAVDATRVYSTNILIDKEKHTSFRVARYNDHYHLYSIDNDGCAVYLTTLNSYQMIKILDDDFFTERFYIIYYESLQKP